MIENWKRNTLAELKIANDARAGGNEGRARVCARRAAGCIAGEYLERSGLAVDTPSALAKLKKVAASPQTPPHVLETINHFLIHMTPEHKPPIDVDLINDVYVLSVELLEENLNE